MAVHSPSTASVPIVRTQDVMNIPACIINSPSFILLVLQSNNINLKSGFISDRIWGWISEIFSFTVDTVDNFSKNIFWKFDEWNWKANWRIDYLKARRNLNTLFPKTKRPSKKHSENHSHYFFWWSFSNLIKCPGGLNHPLHISISCNWIEWNKCVNALSGSFPIYTFKNEEKRMIIKCVNALPGSYTIYTVR